MHIKSLKTYDEIAQSFDAFLELRSHLGKNFCHSGHGAI